ncbi:MAG TPA: hypothetical protein VFR65_06785 [Nitrososphaeraceae archaeon]|jgi:hypothetical protein|nr:hypothetical protein [Nitrososphaeraceae archaeon]
MKYIDGDGNILIPKSVRPIIDYTETNLGSKKGAKKQYRYENLHIREYENYYSVHMDRVDPRIDPLGHLLKDAPEYLTCLMMASTIGLKVGTTFYKKRKEKDNGNQLKALPLGIITGILAGTTTYMTTYRLHNFIRKAKLRK